MSADETVADVSADTQKLQIDSDAGSSSEDNEEEFRLTLDTIPVEVLLHIFSFIDVRFIVGTLSLVCKKFKNLVEDDVTWKIRIFKRWPHVYPPFPEYDIDFKWQKACVEREEQWHLWANGAENMEPYTWSNVHFSSIDAIHIVKTNGVRLCFSGARDRNIVAWNLQSLNPNHLCEEDHVQKQVKLSAHAGWIWGFASEGDEIVSGSWDTNLKLWKIGSSIEELREMTCSMPVLCVGFQENVIVAGTYDKKVYMFDARAGQAIKCYGPHKRSVICMVMDGPRIITGSEDGTIAVYDRTANKVLKNIVIPDNSFPLSLSCKYNLLYIGDKMGRLHLVDAHQQKFNLEKTYDVSQGGKLTGVQHSLGSIITCSTDSSITVFEPTLTPKPIVQLCHKRDELARIDFRDNILAATADSAVRVWMPKL